MMRFLCLVAAAVVVAQAAIPAHLIKSLPGLADPSSLGTQYSGYLNADGGLHFHYMFTLSPNPTKDPVVLWLNGGPGCSSMDGYFYEQGPFHFMSDNGTTLIGNPWNWTSIANVIFLESPVGVGFSYIDSNDYTTNDNVTADRNFLFVQQFFASYPEFLANDFYIAGESYAGIYVPMLSYRVALNKTFNFKGFITGNPVTDEDIDFSNTISTLPFWYGHGVLPKSLFDSAMKACEYNESSNACNGNMSIAGNYFAGYNMYNIYGDCISQREVKGADYPNRRKHRLGDSPPCIDSYAATTYLNNAAVQAAIHVDGSKVPFGQWSICNPLPYTQNRGSVLPEYAAVREMGYDILTYSGDCDSAVPYTGTAAWVSMIGGKLLNPAVGEWNQWTYAKGDGAQVGGHVTYYQNFTYTTVRGSGHMVPQYQPQAGFEMFYRWINFRNLS